MGDVTAWLRRRRQGCLAGVDAGGEGEAVRLCELDLDGWEKPLALNGLLVLPDKLPGQATVPLFDGTITLKEETDFGEDTY